MDISLYWKIWKTRFFLTILDNKLVKILSWLICLLLIQNWVNQFYLIYLILVHMLPIDTSDPRYVIQWSVISIKINPISKIWFFIILFYLYTQAHNFDLIVHLFKRYENKIGLMFGMEVRIIIWMFIGSKVNYSSLLILKSSFNNISRFFLLVTLAEVRITFMKAQIFLNILFFVWWRSRLTKSCY